MNKRSVLAALKSGCTVCWRTSRYHVMHRNSKLVAVDSYNSGLYVDMDSISGTYDKCFIYTGGVGSDD